MFVPITSEVTIKTGMLLKEIATEHLFEVGIRVANGKEVWGEDSWEITEVVPENFDRIVAVFTRQELSQKYTAEVAD